MIRFLFVGEGTSDDGLVPHLEALLVEAGADAAEGETVDYGRLRIAKPGRRTVSAKLGIGLRLAAPVDMVFVHRDADSRDPEPRRREVANAVAAICAVPRHVPVVPVQELEAWLLVDEEAIRLVAGRPSGRRALGLPSRTERVEELSRPKELLNRAILEASETTGRRREKLERRLPHLRRLLLERLDRNGPVRRLSAWKRLVADTRSAVAAHLRHP
ncbi:MAG: DUF4276 family protein [Sandaracinaceae bacterium]